VRIWRSLADVPSDLGSTVTTVGNFDGVHLGHRHVIAEARAAAAGRQPVVVVTFDPHPIAVLRPEHAPTPLTTLDQRAELLAAAGATDVLVVPFDREIAGWSPQRFVDDILVGTLRASVVVVGANFRFGAKAAGDVATLVELGRDRGFGVVSVALDGGPQVWSSTYVRTCLAGGDVEGAAEALGRPYSVRGTVVEGDHRGRELGYPTANIPTGESLAAPGDGVYAGWLRRVDDGVGEAMPAAVSVGTNPTFDGVDRRVEAYVLDRDDLELYGSEVEVAFVARLRGMERFDTVDDLLDRMADDVSRTREVLKADSSAVRGGFDGGRPQTNRG
jgi:riboflavin kinase / FMN adenylyltransferase